MKKRFLIAILFTISGAGFAYLVSILRSGGVTVEWESLVKPPEKAVKVIDFDYIQTISHNIYHYSYANASWEKVEQTPFQSEYELLPLDDCGTLPFLPVLDNFIDSKRACVSWGPGTSLFVFAIDKEGNVFTWNNAKGEFGEIPLLWAFCGAIVGFWLGINIRPSNLTKQE